MILSFLSFFPLEVSVMEGEGIKVRRKGKLLYFWFTADALVKWVGKGAVERGE